MDIFGDSDLVRNTIEKDIHKNPMDSRTDEALKEIYERLRPGEPKTAESSRSLLVARFFDYLMLIALVVLIVVAIYIFTRPVKNYNKPKSRR